MAHRRLKSFLFVCTGNICRSPLAELAMRREAMIRGLTLDIDSAATGHWHLGYPPDPRACRVAHQHGLDASNLRARLVTREDFERFDHILALDHSHLSYLRDLQPDGSKASVSLMLDHLPGRHGDAVADPYYGSDEGFDVTWQEVEAACHHLAEKELGPVEA
ncbi:low molecular weight protein-tyrosine-phosphatase [Gluconobacter japonicus]|uniref:low molecular weight protein-tyrosine-phosphatase n=1 Tax=Gluconobacter japonicus TaxID=376620 RepID=UPI000785C31D|nr:low molecular weight protein-tyrosine-phosphatase [Gluconobacter japonicus]KXV20067.1 phosphotyrosine protein phosphatase [Gluconobacter japonicus]